VDEPQVRERAEALCAALVTGDVGLATQDFSQELQRNLGEVVALLPLPAVEATVDSIEHGSAAYVVVLRVVGESEEVKLQTRWKDRDGHPTVIELSHLSRVEMAGPIVEEGGEDGETSGEGA
jgi:hypothetical protein